MKSLLALLMLFASTHVFSNDNVLSAIGNFAWEKRQLIVFAPDDKHPEYTNFIQLLSQHDFELKDRNLHTWHVIANRPVKLNSNITNRFTNKEIRDMYRVSKDKFKIVLIGYDQAEKSRLSIADLDYIFARIDQMPMRIEEMKSK